LFVYLEGSHPKGIVASHTIAVNPGNHLGTAQVPAAWCERDGDGRLVGRTFYIHFVNGRADTEVDGLGEYLISQGQALRERWVPPADPSSEAVDPLWRWRPERV
jgi:hypothetical protein